MKKQIFIGLACLAICGCFAIKFIGDDKSTETSLLMENVEALSDSENSSCHYQNGYTNFTKKRGGAYDCCQIWVNKAPGDEHCR